jgi:hypothetical protein
MAVMEEQDVVNLPAFPLFSLVYRCRIETERYYAGETHDPAFGYELFRRALAEPHSEASKEAWVFVVAQYKPQAVKWATYNPRFRATGEQGETFADIALANMWRIFAENAGKFDNFPNLATLLSYLKICVYDAVKRYRIVEGDGEMPAFSSPHSPTDSLLAQQAWDCVTAQLNNDEEQIVAYETFVNQEKAQTIADMYAHIFSNVQNVYRIKAKILKRFRYGDNAQILRDCLAGF